MIRQTWRAGAASAFAIVVFAAHAGAARADETPTADDLLARAKVAAGADKRSETERETWSVHFDGLDGTLETSRRGADSATTIALGPFRTARGTSHGQKWRQNENGETILERPEPSQVERVLTQTVARVHEPVEAWEIATVYASGHVVRAYYDPRTDALVRQERTIAGHTSHTTYEDFRTDARGRTRAWHFFGSDERPETDFDYRLVRDDSDVEVSDADIAIPHDRRTLVEFPAGDDAVTLPARIIADRIYVRVNIAGRGLDFLLDSGDAGITLDDAVARQLNLPIVGRTTQTISGSFTTGRAIVPAATIGPLAMHDLVVHTLPFSASEAKSVRVVGLLGFDFLDAVALRIDYAAGTLQASRPGSLPQPAGPGALDVRLNSGAPVTRATIGEATGDDFILDTGAAFSYVVFQRFARAHQETLATAARERLGSGIGGTFGYRPIETKRVVLGPWSFDDPSGVEALAANAFGFDNEDGLIGADILRRFTLYLDYQAGRVFLEPLPRSGVEATSARR